MSSKPLRLHAIYLVLGDAAFLEASVRSIYEWVDGITVVTTYDRDWCGKTRPPDDAVRMVLERLFDPDRKIDLIIASETNEARSRNRAMDFANPTHRSRRVRKQHAGDLPLPQPDYFLIIDPDEIYDVDGVQRLAEYASRDRLPIYRVAAHRYFKRWIYRVDGFEWSTALVRADMRLKSLRNWEPAFWRRVARAAPGLSPRARSRILCIADVPPEIVVFHHGSYVGPRERIVAKLASFGHAAEVRRGWLEAVYDRWTPASRNFNPVWPELYPSAEEIPLSALPPAIRESTWPDGYLT